MEYPAIKLYTGIANILSWVVAGAAFIFGILMLASMSSSPFGGGNVWLGIVLMLAIWVSGFFSWLGVRLLPEVLQILMRLEMNTRH